MNSWLNQSEEIGRRPGCLTQEHLLKRDGGEQSYSTGEKTIYLLDKCIKHFTESLPLLP